MAENKVDEARAALRALMEDILQEFKTGAVAREDLVFRDVVRSTVWRFIKPVQAGFAPWPPADGAEGAEVPDDLVARIEANGARLQTLRADRQWTVHWAREAHELIAETVQDFQALPRPASLFDSPAPTGPADQPFGAAEAPPSIERGNMDWLERLGGSTYSTAGSGGGRNEIGQGQGMTGGPGGTRDD